MKIRKLRYGIVLEKLHKYSNFMQMADFQSISRLETSLCNDLFFRRLQTVKKGLM